MKTMTFHSATTEDLKKAIVSEDFAIEPKLDGVRALTTIDDGKVTFLNRHGKPLSAASTNAARPVLAAQLERDFGGGGYWVLDGEIMPDGSYWIFDLVEAPGVCNADHPFYSRREALEHMAELLNWEDNKLIHVVSHAVSEAGKAALVAMIMADGGEGVMIKKLNERYSERRVRHSLKWKITSTADVIVTNRNSDGKCNASLAVVDSVGKLIDVGDVSMIGRPDVPVGTVLEVKFLYVTEGTRLYQPRVVGVRDDKSPAECGLDQLTDLVVNKVAAQKADAA